jgi:hypothetical protein
LVFAAVLLLGLARDLDRGEGDFRDGIFASFLLHCDKPGRSTRSGEDQWAGRPASATATLLFREKSSHFWNIQQLIKTSPKSCDRAAAATVQVFFAIVGPGEKFDRIKSYTSKTREWKRLYSCGE